MEHNCYNTFEDLVKRLVLLGIPYHSARAVAWDVARQHAQPYSDVKLAVLTEAAWRIFAAQSLVRVEPRYSALRQRIDNKVRRST